MISELQILIAGFTLSVITLYFFSKKPFQSFFKNQSDLITKEIQESELILKEAQDSLDECKKEYASFTKEKLTLLQKSKETSEYQIQQVKLTIKSKEDFFVKNLDNEMKSKVADAKKNIELYMINVATDLAIQTCQENKDLLKKKTSKKLQKEFIDAINI